MTRIESPEVTLSASAQDVARDFQHWDSFEELLSSGPVTGFASEGNRCTFKVTGGVSIHLERTSDGSVKEGQVLTLSTVAPTPVKFTLDVIVVGRGEGCTCQVVCDADLNPFTKMMVEPALKGLFTQMAESLKARY